MTQNLFFHKLRSPRTSLPLRRLPERRAGDSAPSTRARARRSTRRHGAPGRHGYPRFLQNLTEGSRPEGPIRETSRSKRPPIRNPHLPASSRISPQVPSLARPHHHRRARPFRLRRDPPFVRLVRVHLGVHRGDGGGDECRASSRARPSAPRTTHTAMNPVEHPTIPQLRCSRTVQGLLR